MSGRQRPISFVDGAKSGQSTGGSSASSTAFGTKAASGSNIRSYLHVAEIACRVSMPSRQAEHAESAKLTSRGSKQPSRLCVQSVYAMLDLNLGIDANNRLLTSCNVQSHNGTISTGLHASICRLYAEPS